MEELFIKVIREAYHEISNTDVLYCQFTIDLIEEVQMSFDQLLSDMVVTNQNIIDFIQSFLYKLGNAIEICKEGFDKKLMLRIEKSIKNFI